MAQKINENDIQFNNSIPVPGNSGAPSTPAAGQAKIYGIGTSNLRPGFINEGGAAETIMTNGGTTGTTLGYSPITSALTTSSTSEVQATGLSVTVTVPAGGRRVKITAFTRYLQNTTSGSYARMSIWDGTVGSGTALQTAEVFANSASGPTTPVTLIAVSTPAAGSKTYNVGFSNDTGTGTVSLSALTTSPAFILVELI